MFLAAAQVRARARPRTPATSQKVVLVRSATTTRTPGVRTAQSCWRMCSALLESISAGSRTMTTLAGTRRLRISLYMSFPRLPGYFLSCHAART